jgi:tetratricopeptide (TPR) repeat protein
MNRFLLSTAIVGVNIALVQNIAYAESKSAQQVNDLAAGFTLQIIGEKNGSGVLLQQEGDVFTVLTAAHVVAKRTSFTIKTPDGASYQSLPKTIRRAKNNIDLAVIKFRSDKQYDLVKIAGYSYIQAGDIIYVAGFPVSTPSIPAGTLNFTVGNIINDKNTDAQGYSLVYSNFTRWGMSGGPILGTEGQLIGIHGKGDQDQDGSGKTGRNLGIPLKQLVVAAADLGITLDTYSVGKPQQQLNSAAAYVQSALVRQEQGDREGQLEDCNRAIALDPRNAQAYFLRANAKSSSAIYDLANNSSLSKASEVEADYSQAILFNPRYAEAYMERSRLRSYNLSNNSGALADLNQYIALKPQDIDGYVSRAWLKESMNDLLGALADLNKIIAFRISQDGSDTDSDGYRNRGRLKKKMGDFKGALADYNKAIKLSLYPLDYFERGELKVQMNDLNGAIADYDRGVEIEITSDRQDRLEGGLSRRGPRGYNPPQWNRYLERAKLREKLGDFNKALSDYNYALTKISSDPNHSLPSSSFRAVLLVNRAELQAYKLNNIRESLSDFDAAIEVMRNIKSDGADAQKYPYAYYSRGYFKATKFNDLDGALDDFNIAISQFPNYADAYYERGMLKRDKFSYTSGAIADFRKALELYRTDNDSTNAQKVIKCLQEMGVAAN